MKFKYSLLTTLKTGKWFVNDISLFHLCLKYNARIQPLILQELNKWPEYLAFWNELEQNKLIQEITIKSQVDDVFLHGDYIKSPVQNANNETTIVLLHGLTNTRFWIFKQAKIFLEQGYNIVWYDARNHGDSDCGSALTLGENQGSDLQDVIDFLVTKLHLNRIALYGFSLGASTILFWGHNQNKYEVNKTVKGLVLDSAYSNLRLLGHDSLIEEQLLINSLKKYFWKKVLKTLVWEQNLQDINLLNYLVDIKALPALFLHGANDQMLDVKHVYELFYEKIKTEEEKKSKLAVIDKASHGQVFLVGDLSKIDIFNENNLPINTTISQFVLDFINNLPKEIV